MLSFSISCYFYLYLELNLQPPHDFTEQFINPTPISVMLRVPLLGFTNLMFYQHDRLQLITIIYDFINLDHIAIFYQAFLIIGSHIVFISILDLLKSLYSNIYATSLRRLILQCSSVAIILTSSHKGRWFPFFFPYMANHNQLIDFTPYYCFSMFF